MSLYKMEIVEAVIIRGQNIFPATDPNETDIYFLVNITHLSGTDKWLTEQYVLKEGKAYMPHIINRTKLLMSASGELFHSKSKKELLDALNVALTSEDFTATFECVRPHEYKVY